MITLVMTVEVWVANEVVTSTVIEVKLKILEMRYMMTEVM